MSNQLTGLALFAVMAMGCSSKGTETTPAGSATPQANPPAAGQVSPAAPPLLEAQRPPMGALQAPGDAKPAADREPGAAAAGNAAVAGNPGAGASDSANPDELSKACQALCTRAIACKPPEAKMTEAGCVSSCTTPPDGKAAPRAAAVKMTKCAENTDCKAFDTCMGAPPLGATPPGAGAPGATPPGAGAPGAGSPPGR